MKNKLNTNPSNITLQLFLFTNLEILFLISVFYFRAFWKIEVFPFINFRAKRMEGLFWHREISNQIELLWIYGTKYSKMDQVKFMEDRLYKIWRDMVYLSRPCISSIFLKAVFHKFDLVHSWILCPICVIPIIQRRTDNLVRYLRKYSKTPSSQAFDWILNLWWI